MHTEIETLKARIVELERENAYLKQVIEKAGINSSPGYVCDRPDTHVLDPDQGYILFFRMAPADSWFLILIIMIKGLICRIMLIRITAGLEKLTPCAK